MGWLARAAEWLRTAPDPDLATAASLPATSGDIAQVQDLPPEVAAAFGINTETGTISRRNAMRVPAFARGRNVIAGTGGRLSLNAWGFNQDGRPAIFRRQLLEQPDPNTTLQFTLTWLLDDMLCHGVGWLLVLERDGWGYPTRAERVSRDRITVNQVDGTVYVDGVRKADQELIRVDAHHEGALKFGAVALAGALALEEAVTRYAKNPQPNAVLYDKRPLEADVPELDMTAVDLLLEKWRAGNLGATSVRWLNRMIGVEFPTWNPQQLQLVEARQQAAVNVARMLDLPSREVNAPGETGMTYVNTIAARSDRLQAVEPYLVAIEQRLSMGDITPPNQVVKFDRDGYIAGTPAEQLQLAVQAAGGPVMTVDESRARYLQLPPLTTTQRRELAPAPAPTPSSSSESESPA